MPRRWAASALKSLSWGGHGHGAFVPPLVHGAGFAVLPPGAEFDYLKVAGDLRSNTVVAICNAWYATNFPTARPQIGTWDHSSGEFTPLGSDGGPRTQKRAASHPALRLLTTRPNPFDTWRQVWASTIEDFNVDGNAFWLKAGGDPYEVYWLPRCRVHIEPNNGDPALGPVLYYEHHAPNGRKTRYRPDQIVHFRDGIDPLAPHLGISRLRTAVRSIATLNTGETYSAATARNGHAGLLVTPKGADVGMPYTVSTEEKELRDIVDRINRGTTGENAGKAQWASSPMDVHHLGYGPEAMRIAEILNRPETNVAAILGLNTMVLGLPSSAGTRSYANYAEADAQAWKNGLIPRQDAFAEAVTDALIRPEFDDSLAMAWDRSAVDALREDADAKAKRAIDLRQPDATGKPIITFNEARDLCDYPPVEGGDASPIEEMEAMQWQPEGGGEGVEDGGVATDDAQDADDPDADSPDAADAPDDRDTLPFARNGNGRPSRAAKSLDDLDDDDDLDALDAVKAARGGSSRRRKGASPADRTPPNVSAAAARLKSGEATSADQKLLDAWEKRLKRREELRRPQSPEEIQSTVEKVAKERGLADRVEFVAGASPRNAAERKFAEKAIADGRTPIVVERRPALREERDGDVTTFYVGDRPATRVYQAKTDDPDHGVKAGDWINHHEGSYVLPHRTREAAMREARSDASAGVKDELMVARLRPRRLKEFEAEDYLPPDTNWTATFRVLGAPTRGRSDTP